MKRDILTTFPWPWLPTIGLLIFFIFFVVIIFRVSTKVHRARFTSIENLPLNDGEKYER